MADLARILCCRHRGASAPRRSLLAISFARLRTRATPVVTALRSACGRRSGKNRPPRPNASSSASTTVSRARHAIRRFSARSGERRVQPPARRDGGESDRAGPSDRTPNQTAPKAVATSPRAADLTGAASVGAACAAAQGRGSAYRRRRRRTQDRHWFARAVQPLPAQVIGFLFCAPI